MCLVFVDFLWYSCNTCDTWRDARVGKASRLPETSGALASVFRPITDPFDAVAQGVAKLHLQDILRSRHPIYVTGRHRTSPDVTGIGSWSHDVSVDVLRSSSICGHFRLQLLRLTIRSPHLFLGIKKWQTSILCRDNRQPGSIWAHLNLSGAIWEVREDTFPLLSHRFHSCFEEFRVIPCLGTSLNIELARSWAQAGSFERCSTAGLGRLSSVVWRMRKLCPGTGQSQDQLLYNLWKSVTINDILMYLNVSCTKECRG